MSLSERNCQFSLRHNLAFHVRPTCLEKATENYRLQVNRKNYGNLRKSGFDKHIRNVHWNDHEPCHLVYGKQELGYSNENSRPDGFLSRLLVHGFRSRNISYDYGYSVLYSRYFSTNILSSSWIYSASLSPSGIIGSWYSNGLGNRPIPTLALHEVKVFSINR